MCTMKVVIIENESFYRFLFFTIGLFLFWILGVFFKYRSLSSLDRWRWINNLALIIFGSFVMKIILPTGLMIIAEKNKFGLFNFLDFGFVLEITFSILLFDLIIYLQHLTFHHVPVFWRVHAVHHSDTGFDATTALRFHPFETILSTAVKAFAIFIFGFSPLSVIIFEILLNFSAMFNHSNFSLPKFLENIIEKIIVTPDFHRVHHSIRKEETNSNFGFFLSIWDRLFKTYKACSKNDLKKDLIGLESFRSYKDQRLDSLLLQPFRKGKT